MASAVVVGMPRLLARSQATAVQAVPLAVAVAVAVAWIMAWMAGAAQAVPVGTVFLSWPFFNLT